MKAFLVVFLTVVGVQARAEQMTEICKAKLWPVVERLATEDGYGPETPTNGGSLELYDTYEVNSDGTWTFYARLTYSNGYTNYMDYELTGNENCDVSSVKSTFN